MARKRDDNPHAKRDGETLTMLGLFLVILALPVLFGTIWAGSTPGAIVNLAAGTVLFLIGATMAAMGRRALNRLK